MDLEQLLKANIERINAEYAASVERGHSEAYLEGVQIGRLRLSIEMCRYQANSAERTDWTRGFYMALGKDARG